MPVSPVRAPSAIIGSACRGGRLGAVVFALDTRLQQVAQAALTSRYSSGGQPWVRALV